MGIFSNLLGPLGQKKPKQKRVEPPLMRKKPMRKVSAKKAAHRRSKAGQDGLAHMARVKALPCVICGAPGPSDAHHCISGRYGARKASDFETVSLCAHCHRYPYPNAIHSGKESWEARNGKDYEYLPVVADMLAGELT